MIKVNLVNRFKLESTKRAIMPYRGHRRRERKKRERGREKKEKIETERECVFHVTV